MTEKQGRGAQEVEPAAQLTITSLEALKVISDPLRMRIVEALRRAPATVKRMAVALEVAPKSLYYHVNLLEKHGLIRVVDTRLVSGILEKRYRATAFIFNFQDIAPADGPPDSQSRLEAVDSLFAITRTELRRSAQDSMLGLSKDVPPERALHMDWTLLRLAPADVERLSSRLHALAEEYAAQNTMQEGAAVDGQTYRLLLTLFPTYPRGDNGQLTEQGGRQRGQSDDMPGQ